VNSTGCHADGKLRAKNKNVHNRRDVLEPEKYEDDPKRKRYGPWPR
jgi:hypothetical protein